MMGNEETRLTSSHVDRLVGCEMIEDEFVDENGR